MAAVRGCVGASNFYCLALPRVKVGLPRAIRPSRAHALASMATTAAISSKKVLVPVAFGTEEIEATVIVDILRRAGADVLVASIEQDLQIEASRRVKLVADDKIESCESNDFDLIALPGGMPGATRIRDCTSLKMLTVAQAEQQKLVAAICAAPAVALQEWGLLEGHKATCHPSFIDKLKSSLTVGSRVLKDGNIITSRGPGTAMEFALALVEELYGKEKYEEVYKPLLEARCLPGHVHAFVEIYCDIFGERHETIGQRISRSWRTKQSRKQAYADATNFYDVCATTSLIEEGAIGNEGALIHYQDTSAFTQQRRGFSTFFGPKGRISTPGSRTWHVLPSKSGGESLKEVFNPRDWKASKVPQVLVPIANGSEEMEAVMIIDILRRADMKVVVASVEDVLQVIASRKVKIVADKLIGDLKGSPFDLIVLPGGMPGAERLRDCEILKDMLIKQAEEGRPIGAICASPAVVLEAYGILKGKKGTCHPAFVGRLSDQSVAEARVVVDGHCITSRGPGTAMDFALSIVELFLGEERAENIAEAMMFQYVH